MLYLEDGLYMSVNEAPEAPAPFPLKSGFSLNKAYRVIGAFNASETAEAYFIMPNDAKEVWFISNRHLRFAGISRSKTDHVLGLSEFEQKRHFEKPLKKVML